MVLITCLQCTSLIATSASSTNATIYMPGHPVAALSITCFNLYKNGCEASVVLVVSLTFSGGRVSHIPGRSFANRATRYITNLLNAKQFDGLPRATVLTLSGTGSGC